ncbi:MAG: sialidase family protein [Vicinamibacteria bacterium]
MRASSGLRVALTIALFAGADASAHRREDYLQAARLALEPDAVQITLDLTPGLAVAESFIAALDRDRDGSLSADEEARHAEQVVHDLEVALDERPVVPRALSTAFPDLASLRRGEGTVRLTIRADLPGVAAGPHELRFRNRHLAEHSAFLANALQPEGAALVVTAQRRDPDQSQLRIAYTLAPARSLTVRELPSPAGPGSGEPNLAVGADGRILLSWIEPSSEGRHRLRYASRTGGAAWAEARTIAEGAGWVVNWADFPAVAEQGDGSLFAHWLAKSGAGQYAYDVRVGTSRDHGATWSGSVVPHRDATETEHGFVSFARWDERSMGLVWLDGRRTAGSAGHGGGQGAMALLHTTLDASLRLGPETVLDDRVCDCCQTDAARAGDATVVVYRDRSADEVRDIAVVRYANGAWSEPRTIAPDGWRIQGCPVNGPAVAAAGSKVAVAWFTAPHGQARVSVAFSADAGATFGAPIRVDDGRPLGRVDVALRADGTAFVSWLEQAASAGARVRVRRIAPDGAPGDAVTVADASALRSSGFPRMAASGGDVVVAWTDASEPSRVRTTAIVP